jgi:Xaa-Pro aminopeptidase
LLDAANLTKDPDELEKMRDIGLRTGEVLQATWDFIASHKADGDRVVNGDGEALTIGAVKGFVRRALLDRGLEDTGMIFAQGRDGGFPHSRGDAETPLQVGQPIVFDLFPREVGGGYFHDVTRTWCIDTAPDEVREVYNTVMESFDIAVESFSVGKPTHLMQEAVLDYFERKGHPTQRSAPSTSVGYVHSLGHGVGLEIHERPSLSHILKEDVFQAGNIFTIEPGLYYPEKGYGVRVEDTFAVTPDGQLVSLTPFRKDLILPLKR